jgi:hypothetical protein
MFLWVDAQEQYTGSSEISMSIFSRNLHTAFQHSGCFNLHSHQQWENKGSSFAVPLPAFVVIALDSGHSNWGEMKSKCCFDLYLFYNQGS